MLHKSAVSEFELPEFQAFHLLIKKEWKLQKKKPNSWNTEFLSYIATTENSKDKRSTSCFQHVLLWYSEEMHMHACSNAAHKPYGTWAMNMNWLMQY